MDFHRESKKSQRFFSFVGKCELTSDSLTEPLVGPFSASGSTIIHSQIVSVRGFFSLSFLFAVWIKLVCFLSHRKLHVCQEDCGSASRSGSKSPLETSRRTRSLFSRRLVVKQTVILQQIVPHFIPPPPQKKKSLNSFPTSANSLPFSL